MLTTPAIDISIDDLRPLAERWIEEVNKDFGLDIDVEAHLADLEMYSTGENDTTLFTVENENKIIGYMGAKIFKSPLGNQLIANEHYWYVLPEFRSGAAALKLLKQVERWAKYKGCSHLLMNASNLASDLHDRTCRLYELLGMRKFETTFIKEI